MRTLSSERAARYRDWVEGNHRFVAEQTAGRVGYLHIPDMSTQGLAEFHRGFLAQVHLAGLILDVRYNAGGMVSPLVLEKLAHRHLGYDVRRWGAPESYPYHTLRGHLLALTNQFVGWGYVQLCFRELKWTAARQTNLGWSDRYRLPLSTCRWYDDDPASVLDLVSQGRLECRESRSDSR